MNNPFAICLPQSICVYQLFEMERRKYLVIIIYYKIYYIYLISNNAVLFKKPDENDFFELQYVNFANSYFKLVDTN